MGKKHKTLLIEAPTTEEIPVNVEEVDEDPPQIIKSKKRKSQLEETPPKLKKEKRKRQSEANEDNKSEIVTNGTASTNGLTKRKRSTSIDFNDVLEEVLNKVVEEIESKRSQEAKTKKWDGREFTSAAFKRALDIMEPLNGKAPKADKYGKYPGYTPSAYGIKTDINQKEQGSKEGSEVTKKRKKRRGRGRGDKDPYEMTDFEFFRTPYWKSFISHYETDYANNMKREEERIARYPRVQEECKRIKRHLRIFTSDEEETDDEVGRSNDRKSSMDNEEDGQLVKTQELLSRDDEDDKEKKEEFLSRWLPGGSKELPSRTTDKAELKKRLQAKISDIQKITLEKLNADKEKKRKSKKIRVDNNPEDKTAKAQFISKPNPNAHSKKVPGGNTKISSEDSTTTNDSEKTPLRKSVVKSDGQIVYSKFDFIAEDKHKKKKGHSKPTDLLKGVEKHESKISLLESMGKETEAVSLVENQKWFSAINRAQGNVVRDDPNLLRKTIKKQENIKKTHTKKWKERAERVIKEKESREQKRRGNIQGRKDANKKKKLKLQRKKGRIV